MKEWTIRGLMDAYQRGETDPVAVCKEYLERIREIDRSGPGLNAIIEVNPEIMAMAETRRRELADGSPRGQLHGVPILLKDNIDTADGMKTTAGSLAMADAPRPEDAFLVKRLREEGALILGKTNLSEWANFRSTRSNSGWSSRGGQTRNPYVLDRTPCGSSSGSGAAVAANLAVAAVGTETDGSVTCPAAHASLAGFKPSVGAVGRTGIVPISASQDTAGPMARTIADAALLMNAMAGKDPDDSATFAGIDYTANVKEGYLSGKRIGYSEKAAESHPSLKKPFEEALAALRSAGAEIVEGADLPETEKVGDDEYVVLLYEFKHGLAAYFARRGGPFETIDDLIIWNREHADRVMPFFGQEHMEKAAACGDLSDEAYLKARDRIKRLMGAEGISATLAKHRLDALISPTNAPAWVIDHVNGDHYTGGGILGSPAAVAGYPHATVPMGYHRGLPLGLSFVGDFKRDAEILGMASAFECAYPARRPPEFLPTLGFLGGYDTH